METLNSDAGSGEGQKPTYPGPYWRPQTSEIPRSPGVYRFRDPEGRVIYVGKAKNLRNRLTNYFQDPLVLHPRTARMVADANSVQWTVVENESSALILEYQWIKQFNPRYNVMYRDDKSYPYLSVSMGEKYPRVAISRDAHRKGSRYFGPYTKVWAIRETIDLLLPTFPVRSCSPGVFRRAEAQGRPCLLGYIGRCSAPCVGRISEEEHRHLAEELCDFMDGETGVFTKRLEEEMERAAEELDFELAARKRDELAALVKVQEKNTLALPVDVDADVFALVTDDLDASVQAFFVRGGRIRGTRGWVLERADDRDEAQLMHDLLEQVYAPRVSVAEEERSAGTRSRLVRETAAPVSIDDVAHTPVDAIPPEVLVSVAPNDRSVIEEVLQAARGAKVSVRVPQRGRKRELMETVSTNAREALKLHKTRRSGDLTQRALALEELRDSLGLERAPLRVECYDISHTGGTNRVASMVVFEDGAPRKDAYRTFNIRGDQSENQDDTAAMNEVLKRRFRRFSAEVVGEDEEVMSGAIDPDTGKPRRFAYKPDLLVVDGGLPQVNAARDALREVGVDLPVVGLAKRLEEVWIPDDEFPLILPRSSPALYLLQHLRDESHRFAIGQHRKKRSRAQTVSALDGIPGLGPARQKVLLKTFGSVKRIKAATVEEIAATPGFGEKLAAAVHSHLVPESGRLGE
ncbi:excinuclease ABC subunit UvrC [Actinomyces minihominis]|uniref:excinuclease ABC subunit UvrC n=1 Tax=Actinomyces minihominis TaxID=2002838 RepID=UPI000C076910|nr:excinuclease ABC subunit UvrC [Actinomyces minihominis]